MSILLARQLWPSTGEVLHRVWMLALLPFLVGLLGTVFAQRDRP
jgi:hypothetical protein